MTGIGGLKSWFYDFAINGSAYPKDYQENFIKIKNTYNDCITAFKNCKTIKECNDTYEIYENKVDDLRKEFYDYYGNNQKMPIGLADSLDYFEEAVGDLGDRYIEDLTSKGNISVTIDLDFPEDIIDDIINEYKIDYPKVSFSVIKEGISPKMIVKGDYWEVRSFLEDNFFDASEIIEKGVFENA